MQRASYRIVRMWRARQTEIVSCESDPVLTRSSATMKYGKSKHLRIPSAKPPPLQGVPFNPIHYGFRKIDSAHEVSAGQHDWVPIPIGGPHTFPWDGRTLFNGIGNVEPFWAHFIRPAEQHQSPKTTHPLNPLTYSIGSPPYSSALNTSIWKV